MLIKVVLLFLIGMAVLAMFGRLRWPGPPGGAGRITRRSGRGLPRPRRCPACGAWRVGPGRCPCGKD